MRPEGTITPTAEGRYWARLPRSLGRKSLGTHETEALARDVLNLALDEHEKAGKSSDANTFAKFGAKVLDTRELDGVRGIKTERSRFKCHLLSCDFATRPIDEVGAADIVELGRQLLRKENRAPGRTGKITKRTVSRVIALVSAIMTEAIPTLRPDNPCVGIKLRKSADAEDDTEEKWTFLTLTEQQAVANCEAIPKWARLMIRFAIGTGLRQGEQFNLELRDLVTEGETPHVLVRFGSKGKAPKNGKRRRTPLFGDGLAAAKDWLAYLPTYAPKNPHGLVFPGPKGSRRGIGAPERSIRKPDGTVGKQELLPIWLQAAGIDRHCRWHDFRHTCASSLVGGFWGRTWTLQEVKEMLGHSSIAVTEKYAHLGETSLQKAARETSGRVMGRVMNSGPSASAIASIINEIITVGRAGLEPATYGLKGRKSLVDSRVVRDTYNPVVTHLALAYRSLRDSGTADQAERIAASIRDALERSEA